MTENECIVLIAGGPASGKKTLCRAVKREVDALAGRNGDKSEPTSILHESEFMTVQEDVHGRFDIHKLFQEVHKGRGACLVEGCYVLADPQLSTRASLKVWLDCDADTRLSRRVVRHIAEGGTLEDTLREYIDTVKPAFEESVLPTRGKADIILARGDDASVLLAEAVWDLLITKKVYEPKRPRTHLSKLDQHYYELL